VRVLGLDPVAQGEQLRPRIGVMLQSGGIYPSVRAVEMLEHTAKLYKNPLDTGALIERLGLGSAGRTTFRRLSGGQQQRLSLALAVVGRPELVFLDEPTAGLDVQARHATWELIEQLRRDGVTVVLTTHLLDEAERLADTVAIVDSGRVIAHDTPAGLAESTGTADSAIRFTAPPGLDVAGLLATLPAGLSAVEQPAGTYAVAGEITPGVLAAVTAWCAAKDVMPQGLTVGRRTLEDVFLDLTGRELR
jgi:ABC-2 type transport system ATP-binding protein